MTFEVTGNTLDKISADGVIVFPETQAFSGLDKVLGGVLAEAMELENFKGKVGEILVIHTHRKIPANRIFILGLGKKEERDGSQLRHALALLVKKINKKVASLALPLVDSSQIQGNVDDFTQAQIVAEGILLGSYKFNKYREEDSKEKNLETIIISENNKNTTLKIREGIRHAEQSYQAVKIVRDLVNEPAAIVTPTFLAEFAQSLAKKDKNIKCKVYEREELEKMGMGAFLGIAQAAGSDTPPKFIHLEYTPAGRQSKKKLAIVGKGITFDTGGISLKSREHMQTMKLDMAGAAVVIAIFSVISQIKPSFTVMGLVAATPNLVSARSLVPGDVLRAYNGKTIEVLNTDAEGRVTMADSLSYAVKKGATEIIDIATLTGACMVALGTDIAGLFSNNNELKEKVKKAAEKAGEKVWELPLEKDYKELNKSEVADICNIPSTRYGDAITAALFLEEFIDNKPWVHLDIGPAFAEKEYDFGPKGGTGFGVRTLLNFLQVS